MRIERPPKAERSPVREELPRKDQVRKTAAQKRKRRILRKAAVRAAIQVIFFVTMPGAFVAGFTGVRK